MEKFEDRATKIPASPWMAVVEEAAETDRRLNLLVEEVNLIDKRAVFVSEILTNRIDNIVRNIIPEIRKDFEERLQAAGARHEARVIVSDTRVRHLKYGGFGTVVTKPCNAPEYGKEGKLVWVKWDNGSTIGAYAHNLEVLG